MSTGEVVHVAAATVQATLPAPVIFGDWIMKTREFVIVRVQLDNGICGWSFTLTRDGAVSEQISKSLAPIYLGTAVDDVQATFQTALARSFPSHSAGVGLRALSVVDLAVWDARARNRDISIAECLGSTVAPMPATAIIGYPPAQMNAEQVHEQVTKLSQQGWTRFKAPVAATPDASAARLRAARSAAPHAWIGCDAAWTYQDAQTAADFVNSLRDVELGWFEDVFPPGNAQLVAELRSKTSTPIAMGDEQGGNYYPQALINAEAVDVVRVDLTCMGGISGGRTVVESCLQSQVAFAPHMFAHVHSRVFAAWGHTDVPIEWGDQGTGVDPYADSLEQPVVSTQGLMLPLADAPGFGDLVNRDWIASQPHKDPEHILGL